MRGRNGKWFRAGRGAVGIGRVSDVCKFVTGIRGECVGDRNVTRRRGDIDGKERAIGGKLVANFLFLNIEDVSDVLDHLLMGKSHLRIGWAFRGRRGNDVGGVASTVNGRQGAGWNKDGRRGVRHCDRGKG